jgi:hypothetical protein
MQRKDGHSLVAMPNCIHFIHKIHVDGYYTLYLEGWRKKV